MIEDTIDQLAERVDTLGKRIALMPFGEPGSPERIERDRLSDVMNSLAARLHRLRREAEDV